MRKIELLYLLPGVAGLGLAASSVLRYLVGVLS